MKDRLFKEAFDKSFNWEGEVVLGGYGGQYTTIRLF